MTTNNIKEIGDQISVTFSARSAFQPGVELMKITGRNWWGDKFLSYVVRHRDFKSGSYSDITVNKDGTSQF